MSIHKLNTAILDVLGIPWKGQNISRVTFELGGPDKLPTATIERIFPKFDQTSQLDFSWERLELRSATEKPATGIDIDTMCVQAMERVQKMIEKSAEAAGLALKTETLKARIRMGLPVHKAHLNGVQWAVDQRWLECQFLGEEEPFLICETYPAKGGAA